MDSGGRGKLERGGEKKNGIEENVNGCVGSVSSIILSWVYIETMVLLRVQT